LIHSVHQFSSVRRFLSLFHKTFTSQLDEHTRFTKMVSDLRKKKLNYIFDTFFDINQDGSIEENDFELAIENIAKLRGYKKGGPRYQDTNDSFLKIWENLRSRADTNKDNKVSREEWIAMWASPDPVNNDWKTLYKEFMFRLQDANADGGIDAEEFVSVTGTFGVKADEAKKAFDKITAGGKEVNMAYYTELWGQFFTSDDAAAAGNCIFGRTSF